MDKTSTDSFDPVGYVDTNIGTIGHLLSATAPAVYRPHGMARAVPVTTPGIRDRYLADKIHGFSLGSGTIMAMTGPLEIDAAKSASSFDHDFETAAPHYYSALLEDYDITAELTVGERSCFYRFTFPACSEAHLLFAQAADAMIEAVGPTVVVGHDGSFGVRTYFYAVLSEPCTAIRQWKGSSLFPAGRIDGDKLGCAMSYAPSCRQVEVRAGISYISVEQAKANLETEIPSFAFESAVADARTAWNKALGAIKISGGTRSEKTIFYTSLYRTLGRMSNITEGGKYYSAFDHAVHDSNGRDFYVNDALWDTYRCMHPMQLLIDPRRQSDMIASYLRMYDQTGWLPVFPHINGERAVMLGNHAAAFFLDTYTKGRRDFDAEKAYEALRKNAMEATKIPWHRGPLTEPDRVFLEKGFFPALAKGEVETVKEVHSFERRQAVSVTLEHCYDDWCIAQLAEALNKTDDYKYFMGRARNYVKVFDNRIGFMAPRSADGAWVEDFDPKHSGGQGGRAYFAECNSWIFTFHVQHDVAGLMALCGGREAFAAKLDALFTEQYDGLKSSFLNQFPDATGLIGQYAQGNEPSFHIPYLYNYAGQPWKAQRKLREIMRLWYNDGPLGICGDEDGGAMSSWYVFSALGFYPVCPGRPVYDIGSPIFDEAVIQPAEGNPITIVANHQSPANKYIQSAYLNGKPLNRPWFSHSEIANGASLEFEMGPRPNHDWASSPGAAAPSMTT